MRNHVELTVLERTGERVPLAFDLKSLRGAGMCSRDREAVKATLEARRRDGLSWTEKPYWTYRLSPYLLTTEGVTEVQGALTGGEVEAVAVFVDGDEFVGVGSDQCDREMDTLFLEKPKQMCPHSLSPTVWRLDDVGDHWDEIQLESQVRVGKTVVDVQRFTLSELVPLETWIEKCGLREGSGATVFYSGTGSTVPELHEQLERLGLPEETASGVGDEYLMRMFDPVLDREIRHSYVVNVLGDDLDERRSREA